MDNSFISTNNINNIYEYINADMVGKHNINLDNNPKNKKLVKKLTKTVFDKLNSTIDQSNNNTMVGINNFNDMVKDKCVEFLLNQPKMLSSGNKVPKKKGNIQLRKTMGSKI